MSPLESVISTVDRLCASLGATPEEPRTSVTNAAATAALVEARRNLEAASVVKPLFGRALAITASNDLALVARIASLSEGFATALASTEPEPTPSHELIHAVAAGCVLASAVDRIGDDGIAFTHAITVQLARVGREVHLFGLDSLTGSVFDDHRWNGLLPLIDLATVLLAAREREGLVADCPMTPLDDRLDPGPWERRPDMVRQLARLELGGGDCFKKARGRLVVVATACPKADLGIREAADVLQSMASKSNPDLRRALLGSLDSLLAPAVRLRVRASRAKSACSRCRARSCPSRSTPYGEGSAVRS